MLEENFRRAMLLSRGDLMVFVQRPISAWFIGACTLLLLAQVVAHLRKARITLPPAKSQADLVSS
jgi:TctA family transporter